jgi:hypothetical protein
MAATLARRSGGVVGLADWLLTLDQAALAELLAYCAAATVKPVRGPHIDRVATAAGLDLAQWWTPSAKGYFSLVSKAQIAEAVAGGVNAQAAAIGGLKKAEMAERAEALLAGTGWLPCPATCLTATVPAPARRRGSTIAHGPASGFVKDRTRGRRADGTKDGRSTKRISQWRGAASNLLGYHCLSPLSPSLSLIG